MSDSLIIIPTFNEKENIENIIKKVFSLKKQFNILIVDDNSLDGTGNIVKTLQKKYPKKLFIQERSEKLGLGTAYIHGFNWALKKDYEFVFEMDADFSHNPDDLIKLYDVVKNNEGDLAIGSRYVKGVNIVNWPMSRLLLSFFASKYVPIQYEKNKILLIYFFLLLASIFSILTSNQIIEIDNFTRNILSLSIIIIYFIYGFNQKIYDKINLINIIKFSNSKKNDY